MGESRAALHEVLNALSPEQLAALKARKSTGINSDVLGTPEDHAHNRAMNLHQFRQRGQTDRRRVRIRLLIELMASSGALARMSANSMASHLATEFAGVSVSTLRRDISEARKLADTHG